MLFIDLRDRYGKTQVVVSPETGSENLELAKTIRCEWVLMVTGNVARRPEGAANPKLVTGEIELRVEKLTILNRSATPPFLPTAADLPGEDLRLKYRFLDLAAPKLQRILELRHRIVKEMRDYFDEHGFLDVETPCLAAARPKAPATIWCPAASNTACFMRCRSRRSSINKS